MAPRWLILRVLVALLPLIAPVSASTVAPIIGVFAQPATHHADYIVSSYAKWIESAGGRVVPIPYLAPLDYIDELVPQLNGLMLPGGAAKVNAQVFRAVHKALELNDQGVYFPVWGTCLGFEWLLQVVANDTEVVDRNVDALNMSLPLNFTPAAAESQLFGKIDPTIKTQLAEKPFAVNNHVQGIFTKKFESVPKLTDFFNVLTTNVNRRGEEFVSAIESKKYPVYGIQFHPEKNAFEYGQFPDGHYFSTTDHSPEAINAGQYFANFLVAETRKNDQKFKTVHEQLSALIYNFPTSPLGQPEFVQVYLFKHKADNRYW